MGHFARDCRTDKKVEETINLALDDATNEGILLMIQNEDMKAKEYGSRKTMAVVMRWWKPAEMR